jgi:hypothetical protein
MSNELLIDGERFRDYAGFVAELNRAYSAAFGDPPWDGECFDDFCDLDDFFFDLFDSFDEKLAGSGKRLTVRWVNSERSKAELGHREMVEYWSRSLAGIPDGVTPACRQLITERYQALLDEAAVGRGRTLFEWLVFQIGDGLVDLSLE